jgi:hypothetical protein
MSAPMDRADAMKTMLSAVTALSGVGIFVARQDNVAAEVAASLNRGKGVGIIITWMGGRNPEPDLDELRITGSYIIEVWAKEVIRTGATTIDNVLQAAATAIHGWKPDSGPDQRIERCRVTGIEPLPAESGLAAFEISAESTLTMWA